MAWNGLTVLAIAPARAGSKGVARKNMALVGGRSLIARVGAVAKALPWIDRAIISTDDPEFAEEGRRHGLEAPFLRPPELASDSAGAAETWKHAWLESERHYGMRFDVSLWLQPTSPFRRPEHVEATMRALVDSGRRAATTVSPVPGHYTPQKIFTRAADGEISFYAGDGARHLNRQTIPTYWTRNGYCYAVRREQIVDRVIIVEEDCIGVPIEEHTVNIDDPFELDLANWLAARDGI